MAVVIAMMVVVLVLSGEGLAKPKGKRDEDFHVVKRQPGFRYLATKFEEWLDDRSYDEDCVQESNAKATCPVNKADCTSKCKPDNAKFENMVNGIDRCLSKKFCNIDLKNIALSEVQQPFKLDNYKGWCNIRGIPVVTNADKPSVTNVSSYSIIPAYMGQVNVNLTYNDVYLDCEPLEIGSDTNAFSGPVFITQPIVFDIIIRNNKNEASTDSGNIQKITPIVTFSDPKHPSKTTFPQIYQDQVRAEVIKFVNFSVASFWVNLLGELYENVYNYYVYPSCPKCN